VSDRRGTDRGKRERWPVSGNERDGVAQSSPATATCAVGAPRNAPTTMPPRMRSTLLDTLEALAWSRLVRTGVVGDACAAHEEAAISREPNGVVVEKLR
jgi:hypothetical protein